MKHINQTIDQQNKKHLAKKKKRETKLKIT